MRYNRGFTGSPGHGSVSRFLDPAGSPLFNGTITSSSFSGPHFAVFRMGELFIAQRFGNNVLRFVFDAAGNALFNGAITAGLWGQHASRCYSEPSDWGAVRHGMLWGG